MFEIGDKVVHPVRGAGVVMDIEELQRDGGSKQYYTIKPLGQERTSLMVPLERAETMGWRPPIQQSKLDQVRHVLCAEPETLPADYKERGRLLRGRIQARDILQIAQAVRDIDGWRQQKNGLTHRDRRVFRRAMKVLAGEIASAEGIALARAKARVRSWLRADPSPEEESDTEGEDRDLTSVLSNTVRKGVSICRQIATGGRREGRSTTNEGS
jgi:CarD family transcriptional regulator